MKQHYELTFIVSIKYLDNELQQVFDAVKNKITEFGGEAIVFASMGKQKLAYPINHNFQGTYASFQFDMEGEGIKKLDNSLKLLGEIVRHLLIKKQIKSDAELARVAKIQERMRKESEEKLQEFEEKTRPNVKREREEVVAPAAPVAAPVEEIKLKKKEENKMSLEDLDKKLDEILTEEII